MGKGRRGKNTLQYGERKEGNKYTAERNEEKNTLNSMGNGRKKIID